MRQGFDGHGRRQGVDDAYPGRPALAHEHITVTVYLIIVECEGESAR
jgi:hypothetical protein